MKNLIFNESNIHDSNSIIHVCVGLHDKNGMYSKYTGTALCSLMENTRASLVIHILHDDTLSKENCDKLERLVRTYRQSAFFYRIDSSQLPFDEERDGRFTVGTMFRLRILDVLPNSVKRLIYLDSDVIVHLDIVSLWNIDIKENLLAGCISTLPVHSKVLVSLDRYVNAGVLVWNLEKMRQENISLFDDSVDFFKKYGKEWAHYPDQDAINYIFQNHIFYLEEKYNHAAVLSRENEELERECIYHFFGTVPKDVGYYAPDRLFIKYFMKTPWWCDVIEHYQKRIEEKDREKEIVYRLMKILPQKEKKIFWGVGGQLSQPVVDCFDLKTEDYFVDGSSKHWGKEYNGRKVCDPQMLLQEEKDKIVIIVAIFRYNEVSNSLRNMGFVENEHFFNGRFLLSEQSISTYWGDRDQKWDM